MGAAGRENPKHVIAKTKPNTSKLSLDTWGWARCSKVTSEKRVRAPEGLSAPLGPGPNTRECLSVHAISDL